jgi:cytochrome c-type biogenesis protein
MSENLSVLIAFGAGLLSFLSPCVLSLIPSYLCIIGGTPMSTSSEKTGEFKPRLVAGTFSFILGFSAVFIVVSILLTATFSLMGGISRYINWVSGAVIILLGLNILFDFLSFLNYEKRFHLTNIPRGITGAFLAGAAFGAGWTPCVGPVLGSILLLAAQSDGSSAVLYLVFYSAGMGLPFLLASIFFNAFLKTSLKLRSFLPHIRRISGIVLIAIGLLIVTGRYQALNAITSTWQAGLLEGNLSEAETGVKTGGAETAGTVLSGGGANLMVEKTILPEIIRAFSAAGLPIATEGIDPPDFTVSLTNGTERALSGLKGKVVFLNFWATWCGPCRMEMPSMEKTYKRLKDRGFEILAVNSGEKKEQVSGFMRENGFSFPAALDESGTISSSYGIQAIPTTYILDRRGLVISRVVGAIDWNQPGIIAAFEALLDNQEP